MPHVLVDCWRAVVRKLNLAGEEGMHFGHIYVEQMM
jgi:hypothetical protein